MNKIQLSIIIVSYNTKQLTLDTIKSVYRHARDINLEIIVVDNESKDGSVKALKKLASKKKNLHIIAEKENWGFGEAMCSHTPNDKFAFAWQFFLDDLPILRRLIESIHPYVKHPLYSQLSHLDWVTGAFMIVPKKLFNQLKGFDKKIWLYVEELELCYRIKQLGYQVVYDPTHSITHLGGASGTSFIAITNEIKNTIYFFSKHKPKWQMPLVRFAFICGSLLRFIIFGIIGHDEKARQAYWQGLKIAA